LHLFTLFLIDLAQPLNTKNVYHELIEFLVKFENFWGFGFLVMNFYSRLPELHHLTCCSLIEVLYALHFVQMAAPVFLEVGADGTIRVDRATLGGLSTPCVGGTYEGI
jgi:hypothetical protein